jgi:hypothetical protein
MAVFSAALCLLVLLVGCTSPKSVLRYQSTVFDRLLIVNEEPDCLYEAEGRMIEACEPLNEIATLRMREEQPGFWKSLTDVFRIQFTLGQCERAAKRLEQIIEGKSTDCLVK